MSITKYIISSDATIRKAMQVLDMADEKICLMVTPDGKLDRTLTDGDVRRALLNGANFDKPVSELPARVPIVCLENSTSVEVIDLMNAKSVDIVIAVDPSDCPTGLLTRKMMQGPILLSPPHIGKAELALIEQAIDDNWVAPAGPHLMTFEEKLKQASGRKHALAVSSGTAGLHLALRVLGVSQGDRVYVSDTTFIASLQPILYQHAIPVLIDAEPVGWNMSPAALKRQLEADAAAGALPKAIMVVHLYGQSADMQSISKVAEKYNIPIIEDAAESLGATYRNKPSGSHGLLSVFSFNGNKIITTSGGGALVSDRKDLVDRARNLAQQGRDDAEHYQHSAIAYNYRMSNILAGIGIAQIDMLMNRVASRRKLFDLYQSELGNVPGISFQENLPQAQGSRWLTVINMDPNVIQLHPYRFMRQLKARGIETRPAWKPMHMQPLCHAFEFAPHGVDEYVSGSLFLRSLCLPSGSSLTQAEQLRIISAIQNIIMEG